MKKVSIILLLTLSMSTTSSNAMLRRTRLPQKAAVAAAGPVSGFFCKHTHHANQQFFKNSIAYQPQLNPQAMALLADSKRFYRDGYNEDEPWHVKLKINDEYFLFVASLVTGCGVYYLAYKYPEVGIPILLGTWFVAFVS